MVIWRGATPRFAAQRLLDSCILCLPSRGMRWRDGEEWTICPADSAVMIDPLASADAMDGVHGQDIALLLPRQLATWWPHDRAAISLLGPAHGFAALMQLAGGLLDQELDLSPPQARLAGRAVFEWLTAVLGAGPERRTSVAERRGASLVERMADHIDRHLADPLDASTLCDALGCSRSVLYRAAGPVGGVAVFVTQRRLSALYARLNDPAERRTVSALARDCGFNDAAGFSRIFRRHFGRTATEVRRHSLARRATDE